MYFLVTYSSENTFNPAANKDAPPLISPLVLIAAMDIAVMVVTTEVAMMSSIASPESIS